MNSYNVEYDETIETYRSIDSDPETAPLSLISKNSTTSQVYSMRHGQISSITDYNLDQIKYEAMPKAVEPLPKQRVYHLVNHSEPITAWNTIKIFDKKVIEYKRKEPKLQVYSIGEPLERYSPTPLPEPKLQVYAINKRGNDMYLFANNPQAKEKIEHAIAPSPRPRRNKPYIEPIILDDVNRSARGYAGPSTSRSMLYVNETDRSQPFSYRRKY
jgi:hypothetical protein